MKAFNTLHYYILWLIFIKQTILPFVNKLKLINYRSIFINLDFTVPDKGEHDKRFKIRTKLSTDREERVYSVAMRTD